MSSELDDAVARVVFDLSQLDQKSWFHVVRRVMIESQEIGRRELRADLQAAQERIAALETACKYYVRQHHVGLGPFETCDCLGCKTYTEAMRVSDPRLAAHPAPESAN
jgi:hypothetical protein